MPIVTGFKDVLFPLTLSIGAVGGEETQVFIHVTGSGYEYRNNEWEEMRGRWDCAANVRTLDQAREASAFFRTCRGPTFSFRFQAPDDYTATLAQFGIGDGTSTIFPLFIPYSDEEETVLRRIVLPVNPARFDVQTPFDVFADDVLVPGSEYSVTYRNGRVEFDTPPANGVVLKWSGEFHIPARWGTRQLRKSMLTHEIVSFQELPIVEILPYEILTNADP